MHSAGLESAFSLESGVLSLGAEASPCGTGTGLSAASQLCAIGIEWKCKEVEGTSPRPPSGRMNSDRSSRPLPSDPVQSSWPPPHCCVCQGHAAIL